MDASDTVDRAMGSGDLTILNAEEIEMRTVEWLWPGRFARGKFGLIAGLPDMGKGQIAAFIAGALPTGKTSPAMKGPRRKAISFGSMPKIVPTTP
jgi:hypothetical protein